MADIRVLLVDDHPIVRMGLCNLIESARDIEVVGEAGDGLAAIDKARDLQPDVMVLDISMPRMNGIEVVRTLKEQGEATRIIILSGYADAYMARELFSNGICGYILKDEANTQIVDAIRGAAQGQLSIASPAIAAQLENFMPIDQPPSILLTPREKEILKHIIAGKSNREIAQQLGITDKTVEKHLSNIYRKLGVVSRVEAAVMVMRSGWDDS